MHKDIVPTSEGMDTSTGCAMEDTRSNLYANLGELGLGCSQEDISRLFSNHDAFSFPTTTSRVGPAGEDSYGQQQFPIANIASSMEYQQPAEGRASTPAVLTSDQSQPPTSGQASSSAWHSPAMPSQAAAVARGDQGSSSSLPLAAGSSTSLSSESSSSSSSQDKSNRNKTNPRVLSTVKDSFNRYLFDAPSSHRKPSHKLNRNLPMNLENVVVNHDASKSRAPACTRCRSKKLKCDEVRPCSSCVKRGFGLECSNEMPDCLPDLFPYGQRPNDGETEVLLKIARVFVPQIITKKKFEVMKKRIVDICAEAVSKDSEENVIRNNEVYRSCNLELEKWVTPELPQNVNYQTFLKALPLYLRSPGKKCDQTASAVAFILQMISFRDFCEFILFANKEVKGIRSCASEFQPMDLQLPPESQGLISSHLNEANEALKGFGQRPSGPGWVEFAKNKSIHAEKKITTNDLLKQKNEMWFRIMMEAELTYVECCDMFHFVGDRRQEWDTNYQGHEIIYRNEQRPADDFVMKYDVNLGRLMHLFNIPRSYTIRVIRRHNFPAQNMCTQVTIPWNLETNTYDENNKTFKLKVTTIGPSPRNPEKSIIMETAKANIRFLPIWMQKIILSTITPKIIGGMIIRYIQKIKKKNKVVDLNTVQAENKSSASFPGSALMGLEQEKQNQERILAHNMSMAPLISQSNEMGFAGLIPGTSAGEEQIFLNGSEPQTWDLDWLMPAPG